jgi:hypothetical protein
VAREVLCLQKGQQSSELHMEPSVYGLLCWRHHLLTEWSNSTLGLGCILEHQGNACNGHICTIRVRQCAGMGHLPRSCSCNISTEPTLLTQSATSLSDVSLSADWASLTNAAMVGRYMSCSWNFTTCPFFSGLSGILYTHTHSLVARA